MQHDIEVMRICVRAYLRHIHTLDTSMREIEDQIARIRSRLEGLGYDPGNIGAPNYTDKMSEQLARLSELESAWTDAMECNHDQIESARVLCPPENTGRWACWLHWVDGRTWGDVGRAIGYSPTYTRCEIAESGIRELYADIPEEWRRMPIPNAAPQ